MTKSRSSAVLEKRQAKYESRPVDECAAAAAAGRLIEVSSDFSTPPTGPSPYQGRAPPLLGYSIREFCTAVGISVSYFYELKQAGLAPRTMKTWHSPNRQRRGSPEMVP
jgi:hypothetical protein